MSCYWRIRSHQCKKETERRETTLCHLPHSSKIDLIATATCSTSSKVQSSHFVLFSAVIKLRNYSHLIESLSPRPCRSRFWFRSTLLAPFWCTNSMTHRNVCPLSDDVVYMYAPPHKQWTHFLQFCKLCVGGVWNMSAYFETSRRTFEPPVTIFLRAVGVTAYSRAELRKNMVKYGQVVRSEVGWFGSKCPDLHP